MNLKGIAFGIALLAAACGGGGEDFDPEAFAGEYSLSFACTAGECLDYEILGATSWRFTTGGAVTEVVPLWGCTARDLLYAGSYADDVLIVEIGESWLTRPARGGYLTLELAEAVGGALRDRDDAEWSVSGAAVAAPCP